MAGKMTFRRINGHIVPISMAKEAAKTAAGTAAALAVSKVKPSKPVKPHMGFSILSTGAAIASGVLSAATFFSGGKSMIAGAGGSLALDFASSASNVASFAGSKGTRKDKLKAGIKQEAFNTLLGNGIFVGGLLAIPSSRKKILSAAAKVIGKFRG